MQALVHACRHLPMQDARTVSKFTNEFFKRLPSQRADAIVVGYCAGILADGMIEDSEMHGLKTLVLHSGVNPFVSEKLIESIEKWERSGDDVDLAETLKRIAGGDLAVGEALKACTAFCADPVPEIDFSGAFAFTGDFERHTRMECEQECERLGGVFKTSVSPNLDYLIVGVGAPPAYINGSYGRKIEKALILQKKGQCQIVTEHDWMAQAHQVAV